MLYSEYISYRRQPCFLLSFWSSSVSQTSEELFHSKQNNGLHGGPNVGGVLAERRHGPLLDLRGALWVLLQGLHDLTVVQHESHQLELPLSFGRGAVDRPDHLQLLQVLKGLKTVKRPFL